MEISNWQDFKTLVASKKLLMQYTLVRGTYEIYAPELYFNWHITLVPEMTTEWEDFEAHYKTGANLPLEFKGAVDRPSRVSPSPQPLNTVENWKGYWIHMDGITSTYVDVSFPNTVQLHGGSIYSFNCNIGDKLKADVLLASNNMKVGQFCEDIYVPCQTMFEMKSNEASSLYYYTKLRITAETNGTTDVRDFFVYLSYFQPIA
jgi:hypothetical protein